MTIHGPYAALDLVFLVEVDNGPDLVLEELFAHLAAPDATATRRYRMAMPDGDEEGWLEVDGERTAKAELGSLHEHLVVAVQLDVIEALADPVVHACFVEHRGRGVLVAGLSGRGKSTFTARLLGDGGALVTEDLSALGTEGVRPYPRPVALSAESLEALGLPVPDDDCGCGCMKHVLTPESVGGRVGDTVAIDILVLCDACSMHSREVSLGEALARLFDEASLGNVVEPAALLRLGEALAGARCIALGTAELEPGMAAFLDLVATGPERPAVVDVAAERFGEVSVLYVDGEAVVHTGDKVHHLDAAATAIWVLHTEGLTDEQVAEELGGTVDVVAATLERLRELELPAPTA